MYWVLRVIAWLVGLMSDRSMDWLARGISVLEWRVLKIRRRIVMKNLKIAFGDGKDEAELNRIGEESVYHMALSVLETFHHFPGTLWQGVQFKDEHYPIEALKEGRGMYLLCVHTGNIDAMAAACVHYISPGYTAVKKVGSKGVNRFVEEMRSNYGLLAKVKKEKGEGFRIIQELLGRGEVAAFFLDQTRPGSPKIPFFGHPAKTSTSLAGIWRRVPAPVVPGMSRRLGPNRHVGEFFPPVPFVATDDPEQDLITNTRVCLEQLEMMIRLNPEQYLWMHNRWKD